MGISDCYDPAVQEERRQAEWDRLCALFPRCCACGHSVYGPEPYHVVAEEFIFCDDCFTHDRCSTDLTEVD